MLVQPAAKSRVASVKQARPVRGRRFEQTLSVIGAFAQGRDKLSMRGAETSMQVFAAYDDFRMHPIGCLGETRNKIVAAIEDRGRDPGASALDTYGDVVSAREKIAEHRVAGLSDARDQA